MMLSIYQLKPAFQKLLLKPMALFYQIGLTANHITLASIAWSVLLGICLWYAPGLPVLYWLLPIGLLMRMALNAIDGMMARIYRQQSQLGEILNEMGDILSDAVLFIPILYFPGVDPLVLIFFVFSATVNETAGILSKTVGGDRRYDGPMGKSDRALLLGVLCILLALGIDIAAWMNPILLISIVLMSISSFTRLNKSIL